MMFYRLSIAREVVEQTFDRSLKMLDLGECYQHCYTPVHHNCSVTMHKNGGRLLRLALFLPSCIVTDTLKAIIKHHGCKANKCDHLGVRSYTGSCVISE